MKQWYEELFENYAEGYDRESFTQGTIHEADFIEQEIGRNRSLRMLEVGCGTGRCSRRMIMKCWFLRPADERFVEHRRK